MLFENYLFSQFFYIFYINVEYATQIEAEYNCNDHEKFELSDTKFASFHKLYAIIKYIYIRSWQIHCTKVQAVLMNFKASCLHCEISATSCDMWSEDS